MITPHLLNSKCDAKHAEHAEVWYNVVKPPSDAVLAELETAKDKTELITVGHCPVQAIREVLDNGQDVYLGDINFTRLRDGKLLGPSGVEVNAEQAPRYAAENAGRAIGDPDIVWTVGGVFFGLMISSVLIQKRPDYLTPSHHGRGIMSDALKTIMYDWAIPRMNARRISVSALRGNKGSAKVFQKNGFHLTALRENHMEARGKMRDLHILEWNFDDSNVP